MFVLDQLIVVLCALSCVQLVGLLLCWRLLRPLAQQKLQLGELEAKLHRHADDVQAALLAARSEASQAARASREEASRRAQDASLATLQALGVLGGSLAERLDAFAKSVGEQRLAGEAQSRAVRADMVQALDRVGGVLRAASDGSTQQQLAALAQVTKTVQELSVSNERRQEALKQAIEHRLDALRQENAAKLEEMRQTVDEKLQGTLEKRLGASFSMVNQNLERVFKSVGEMQTIATGVGDLKRVLLNVKSRGIWGETTLGALLEQTMTPEQYGKNVEVVPNTNQRVEFAIRLPQDGATPLWLPIDAKMPMEDYERLVDAADRGDAQAVEECSRALERAVRLAGKEISTKYVQPPATTDFAVMFLPTEGLFAEVVRRPGLVDALQRQHRIVVTGPTTLGALLTSLRMGFRTLAIQQRSSEVWEVLGAVKYEFGKFGSVLDKVTKKLDEASNVVRDAGTRRRALDRKLRGVEVTAPERADAVLAEAAAALAPTEAAPSKAN